MDRTRPDLALWEEILVRWANGEPLESMRSIGSYAVTDLRSMMRKRFESVGVVPPEDFRANKPEATAARRSKLGTPLARFMTQARAGLRPSTPEARAARDRILHLEKVVRDLAADRLRDVEVRALCSEPSSDPEADHDAD